MTIECQIGGTFSLFCDLATYVFEFAITVVMRMNKHKTKQMLLFVSQQTFESMFIKKLLIIIVTNTNEPPHKKTNNVVSKQVRHKPGCTTTEAG